MKMLDIEGNLTNVDIRQSSYPLRAKSKSKLQGLTSDKLQEKYPYDIILEEFFLPSSRLSVDFFLPKRRLVIEVDSALHYKHIPFFHGDINENNLGKQISHDRKKEQWVEDNDFKLIRINTQEDLLKLDE